MTRWSVCTDKEDLMPGAAAEEAREERANTEVEDLERKCPYSPSELAPAARNAVEVRVMGTRSDRGDIDVQVLRYIGGSKPIAAGQRRKLEISRSNNAASILQQAHAFDEKIVVLYPGDSYGEIYPTTNADC
jgi:hypothetical protein